jgi:hypothetical protein
MTSAARANMTSAVPKIGLPSQENIPTISASTQVPQVGQLPLGENNNNNNNGQTSNTPSIGTALKEDSYKQLTCSDVVTHRATHM